MSKNGTRDAGLPDPAGRDPGNQHGNHGGNHLYIDTLNYSASDLTELRRLAETDQILARRVVETQNEQHWRETVSERIGLVATSLIAITGLAGAVMIVVSLGWWQTVVFTLAMLGASHLVRTVLTGEWSDTSWLGRLMQHDKTED